MRLSLKEPENKTLEVKFGDEIVFSIVVRQPSYLEVVKIFHRGHGDDGYLDRLIDLVIDWKDVTDDEDKIIPYSREMLQKLIVQNGGLVYSIIGAISGYVSNVGGINAKKSQGTS